MESHAIPPFPLPRRTFGSSHARHRHRRTRRRGQPRHAARLSRHATVRPAHRAHAVGDTPPDRRRSVDDERAGASQGSEPADAIASYWRSAWTGCATYSAPTPDALATHATDCHRLALSGPGPQSKRSCALRRVCIVDRIWRGPASRTRLRTRVDHNLICWTTPSSCSLFLTSTESPVRLPGSSAATRGSAGSPA